MSKDYPMWVCHDCGSKAGKAWTLSTWHEGICGVCVKLTAVTEPRDYGSPDFTKLIKEMKENG